MLNSRSWMRSACLSLGPSIPPRSFSETAGRVGLEISDGRGTASEPCGMVVSGRSDGGGGVLVAVLSCGRWSVSMHNTVKQLPGMAATREGYALAGRKQGCASASVVAQQVWV